MNAPLCACGCGMPTTRIKRSDPRRGYKTGEHYRFRIGHWTRVAGCGNAVSHGYARSAKSPEYTTWTHIKRRCCNPNDRDYADYGAVGVTVCSEWLHDFRRFLADMGRKPSPRHSIDRIDRTRGYSPDNCRWATAKEQVENRSVARRLTVDGLTKSVKDWADAIGLRYHTLLARLDSGMEHRRAVTMPLGGYHLRKNRPNEVSL